MIALAAVPSALAASPGAAAAPAAAPATGVWAWGAFQNATYRTQVVGAYADAFNLSNGTFSRSLAQVAEVVDLHALDGAFAVVNASAPTASTRSVEAEAVQVANYTGLVVVAGALPAAGTYAPGGTVALANMTSIYYASIRTLSAHVAFANYTYANGSIALENEHVASWAGINVTMIAYQWPNFTADANGSTTVSYRTAAAANLGWVADSLTANFTPALPIASAPLYVGKSWNATTQLQVVGWAAYASASAYRSGSVNATSGSSGGVSLNATATLGFGFSVVGSQTVIFPNGTSGTGYEIVTTVNGSASGSYALWDGLVVLPTGGTPPVASPVRAPERLAAIAPAAAPAAASASTVEVGSSGLPLSTSEKVASGATLAAAPQAPANASQQIRTDGVPARPVGATVPAVEGPPTLGSPTGTSPSSPPPTPPPATPPAATPPASSPSTPPAARSAPARTGLDPFALAAVLAGVAAVFLAVEVARQRARR